MRYRDVGVVTFDPKQAMPGITLIAPLAGKTVYLIGLRGETLHQWNLPFTPGNYAYLLPNGNLLWSGRTPEGPPIPQGKGGILREYNWDGEVLWEYRDPGQHHDFRRLPNGNTIYIGREPIPREAVARIKGGLPGTEHDGQIYGDYLREVNTKGETVWEWYAHRDMELERHELCPLCARDEFAHANTCAPLPDGNIMISFRRLNLIAIIDRETKRFRWEKRDDTWGHQHDCHLLPNGNILLFANGCHGTGIPFSRVIEMDMDTGKTIWEYQGWPQHTFYSPNISGAQRLPNGNTLVCEGRPGRVFEVTHSKEIVWEYVCPFFENYGREGPSNALFRSYRYTGDSPEIAGRLSAPVVW